MNKDQKNRLLKIIKSVKLNQTNFAKILYLGNSSITGLLKGYQKAFTDSTLELIRLKFGIDTNWLDTGEGDMFLPKTEEKRLDDQGQSLLYHYKQLDKERAALLLQYSKLLVLDKKINDKE